MGLGDKFKNLAKQAQDSVAEHKDVTVVPSTAIRRSEGRSFVYVEVKEGITDGTDTEITSGLRPGEIILVP